MKRTSNFFLIRISIHALREEGDELPIYGLLRGANFYPRPPRGGRRFALLIVAIALFNFYPRPPRGGRRKVFKMRKPRLNNFYPRPPRGGRRLQDQNKMYEALISIHALREEGDAPTVCGSRPTKEFLSTPSARRATSKLRPAAAARAISIHALREEGDQTARVCSVA